METAVDLFLTTVIQSTPPAANAPLESAMAAQHTTAWWMTVGAVVLDTARLTEARAAVMAG